MAAKIVTRIYDQGTKLELWYNANSNVMIDKASIKLRLVGDIIYLYDNSMSDSVIQNGTSRVYTLNFASITVPLTFSAAVLESSILDMLNTLTPAPVPSTPGQTWSSADSVAYQKSIIVKAAPGVLNGFTGYNSGAAQFIQVHNALAVPANGAIPVIILLAAAQSNFYWDADDYGRWFTVGITMCNSSTGPTKTIGANDCWFNVLFK